MRKNIDILLSVFEVLSAFIICAFVFVGIPTLLSPLWEGLPLFIYFSPWYFYGETYFAHTPNWYCFLGFGFLSLFSGLIFLILKLAPRLASRFLYVLCATSLGMFCGEMILSSFMINSLSAPFKITILGLGIILGTLGFKILSPYFSLNNPSRWIYIKYFGPALVIQGFFLLIFAHDDSLLFIHYGAFFIGLSIALLASPSKSASLPRQERNKPITKIMIGLFLPLSSLFIFGPSFSETHSLYLFSPNSTSFNSLPHSSLLEIELDPGGTGQISLWTSPTWGSPATPINHLRQLQVDLPPSEEIARQQFTTLISSCLPGATLTDFQPPDSEVDAVGYTGHLQPIHPFALFVSGNCPHVRQILIHGPHLNMNPIPIGSTLLNDQWTWNDPNLQKSPINIDWSG